MNVDGFTFTDWYTMPVHMRNLYVQFANEVAEKRAEQLEKKK